MRITKAFHGQYIIHSSGLLSSLSVSKSHILSSIHSDILVARSSISRISEKQKIRIKKTVSTWTSLQHAYKQSILKTSEKWSGLPKEQVARSNITNQNCHSKYLTLGSWPRMTSGRHFHNLFSFTHLKGKDSKNPVTESVLLGIDLSGYGGGDSRHVGVLILPWPCCNEQILILIFVKHYTTTNLMKVIRFGGFEYWRD